MSSIDRRRPKLNIYELTLSLSSIIGVNTKERNTPQIIRLILQLKMTPYNSEMTTIKDIENITQKLALKEHPLLIERMCYTVAMGLFEHFKNLVNLTLTIEKPGALVCAQHAYATIKMDRPALQPDKSQGAREQHD